MFDRFTSTERKSLVPCLNTDRWRAAVGELKDNLTSTMSAGLVRDILTGALANECDRTEVKRIFPK